MLKYKSFISLFSLFFLLSCSGGGDNSPTAPLVELSSDSTSVLLTNTSTLTWSSSNATSCSASGNWSGTKATSGSEAVPISFPGNNSFTLVCSGPGGSGTASANVEGYRMTDGIVVDGYISGAEVFIDEDNNWISKSTELSTTSDNNGEFSIKYANGNLVSIGGRDLDSQIFLDNLLITHRLSGHSDFKVVTPVTSLAAFMTEASNVNAVLGIDPTIDIYTFDPVANKGDKGINDYFYEKGSQLTVLAYALQNVTNNLNITTETTQDYFKAITEEIEKEYTNTKIKVDIETEDFITKALNNVVEAKSVTITDEAKANTTMALSKVMPLIEGKSSDDITTAVFRFAVSTLQTDIQAIANGTASAETITNYTSNIINYVAIDQDIDANLVMPNSERCPVVYDKKLYRISDISNSDIKFKKIFWGDSVVSDMHDLDFYSMEGEFQEIGHGGQVIACALEEVQNVINFNPDTVIIYIGGNDADGQSWYGPDEAFSYYKQIIKILAENNITPIIHLIHEASLSRDRTYVQILNKSLMDFAEDNNVLVIPNMSELSYEVSAEMVSNNIDYKCNTGDCSPYSYDGEHLKHQGYVIWINHIKEFVPGF